MYAFFVLLLLMYTGAIATEAFLEGVKLTSESPPVFSMLGSPKIFPDNNVKCEVYRKGQGKIIKPVTWRHINCFIKNYTKKKYRIGRNAQLGTVQKSLFRKCLTNNNHNNNN